MRILMDILEIILGIILPLIPGPFAGFIYIIILKRKDYKWMFPFWILLIGAYILIGYRFVSISSEFFSLSGMLSCLLTPVAAIFSIIVIRIAWKKISTNKQIDKLSRRLYLLGLIIIPTLQLFFLFLLSILGPILCQSGITKCSDW
jgi:hypothetical protein